MSKQYKVLLSSILALFGCLLLMLSYFNRLATDDYYFIWDVRNHGVVTGVTSQYMEWCGRFAATFAMDVFYKAFDVNQAFYAFVPLASALLVFAGVFYLIRNAASHLSVEISISHKRIAAASFTALLFFLSVDIGESWFWFCAQSSYMWSIIAFIFGMVFLTNSKKYFPSTLFSILCFIYVGGSSEVYSAIFGLFFTAYLVLQYRKLKAIKSFLVIHQRTLIVYVAFAISFLLFLVAPGNYLRDGLFPEHQFWNSFYITAKSIVKFGALYLPFKLMYIAVFSTPFLFLGDALNTFKIKDLDVSFKSFFYKISLLFASTVFIFFFLVAYVMVETGPPRLWFLVSFLLAIYCSLLFFYAGYKSLFNLKQLAFIKNGTVIFGITLMSFHLITQYFLASNYAKANDTRIEYITALNKTIDTDTLIALPPLPPPGMLYSTEIGTDTSHFTNKELRLGYDLKFHISLRK